MPTSDLVPTPEHFRPYAHRIWRIVEGQHRISTNRLAEGPVEQDMLEQLIEEVKPILPPAARGLHYLLGTPFRYGYARPSRFRRAGERPGIFYGSESIAVSVAETAYWRLLFFSRSPGIRLPSGTSEHSAFTVPVRLKRLIDLTRLPYRRSASIWTDPADYEPCQSLATAARRIDTQAIRYTSARDPARGVNLALLDPAAFSASTPTMMQSWHFRFERGLLTVCAAFPSDERYRFSFEQFGLAPPK